MRRCFLAGFLLCGMAPNPSMAMWFRFENPHEEVTLYSLLKIELARSTPEEIAGTNYLNFHDMGITTLAGSPEDLKGLFNKLTGLKSLYLARNKLKMIPPNSFQGLVKLKELNLRCSNLKTIAPNSFEGLVNLTELDLAGNHLTTLEENTFKGLGNLIRLDLSCNKLKMIAPNSFEGLGNLRTLALSGNELPALDENTFQGLDKLETLHLACNHLTTLEEKTFEGLVSLKYLTLHYNGFFGFPPDLFKDLPLTELTLFRNLLPPRTDFRYTEEADFSYSEGPMGYFTQEFLSADLKTAQTKLDGIVLDERRQIFKKVLEKADESQHNPYVTWVKTWQNHLLESEKESSAATNIHRVLRYIKDHWGEAGYASFCQKFVEGMGAHFALQELEDKITALKNSKDSLEPTNSVTNVKMWYESVINLARKKFEIPGAKTLSPKGLKIAEEKISALPPYLLPSLAIDLLVAYLERIAANDARLSDETPPLTEKALQAKINAHGAAVEAVEEIEKLYKEMVQDYLGFNFDEFKEIAYMNGDKFCIFLNDLQLKNEKNQLKWEDALKEYALCSYTEEQYNKVGNNLSTLIDWSRDCSRPNEVEMVTAVQALLDVGELVARKILEKIGLI